MQSCCWVRGAAPAAPSCRSWPGSWMAAGKCTRWAGGGFRHPEVFESSLPHRTELDNFWKRFQELEQHVDQLEQADVLHRSRLARLSHELGGLNQTTSHLQAVLGTVTAAGFRGKGIQ